MPFQSRPSASSVSGAQLDRAVGAVLASAVGDALGSQYEFKPSLPDSEPVVYGVGPFGHEVGEWTDDTSMAVPILRVLAEGRSLEDPDSLSEIVGAWVTWSKDALDVGAQTRSVFHRLRGATSERAARAAAEALHASTGKSAGNGSLMRTGPVALGYLAKGDEDRLVEAAGRIAQLTHWEQDNVDACVLWCLAIRHAILTGTLDVAGQVPHLAPERRTRWMELIAEASEPGLHPRDVANKNGWVVGAFQAALAAVTGADSLVEALERAVRCGEDTDTVAAIAGSLAGALWGQSAIPADLLVDLHGWPGLDAQGLARTAALAARGGGSDGSGWPASERMAVIAESDFLAQLPGDDKVWVGSLTALDRLRREAPDVDAVVSLCRVGTAQIPEGLRSVQVRLIDQPGSDANANLAVTLAGAADAVAKLREQGHTVFLHCMEGRSRTSAVAALYAARHLGMTMDEAWGAAESALPMFRPQAFLREAVEQIVEKQRTSASRQDARESEHEPAPKWEPNDRGSRRLVIESWWAMSEVAARHPEFRLIEMHPGGGQHDVLALVLGDRYEPLVQLNRGGGLFDARHTRHDVDWDIMSSAANRHDLVKYIERVAGLPLEGQRPATTRRTLVYRLIAQFLAAQANSRRTWDARSVMFDTSGDIAQTRWIEDYPHLREALRVDPDGYPFDMDGAYRHWALVGAHEDDAEPIVAGIICEDGRLHHRDGTIVDLFAEYQAQRKLTPILVRHFAEWLP